MATSQFPEKRSCFIGIDSDGCAFNTMELKHRQVFIPQAIASLGFQDIAEVYRRTAERVNLYSRSRGANRFEAIALCLDEMRRIPAIQERIPDPAPLREFLQSGRPLSNDSFADYLEDGGSDLMQQVLHWSSESNRRISEIIVDNPPFAGVRETIAEAHRFANTMIVSATPASALEQEWGAAGLLEHIDLIAGQEFGPKKAQLASALAAGFTKERSLMVGDAPGDHAAAESHGILFFPIIPGSEEDSWRELGTVGLRRFQEGTFAGQYQTNLLEQYYQTLDSQTSLQI